MPSLTSDKVRTEWYQVPVIQSLHLSWKFFVLATISTISLVSWCKTKWTPMPYFSCLALYIQCGFFHVPLLWHSQKFVIGGEYDTPYCGFEVNTVPCQLLPAHVESKFIPMQWVCWPHRWVPSLNVRWARTRKVNK
jgi:hypothetical protein